MDESGRNHQGLCADVGPGKKRWNYASVRGGRGAFLVGSISVPPEQKSRVGHEQLGCLAHGIGSPQFQDFIDILSWRQYTIADFSYAQLPEDGD